MNISLDCGTQQNPTRREGLNLAAGTQKISPFITLSLQKTHPHVGIRRPFQVNLIVLFLWSWRTSELNSAEQPPHPLKAAAVRQSLGISFSLQKKKNPRKQGDMSVLLCGIIHFTLIPISQLKLCLNKQGLRLSEAAPTHLAMQETPLQDTGSGGQAWNRRICPFVSQVLSLIFRFSFL